MPRPRRAARKPPPTPEERRARILDAALREFVARGFEAASTNAIAEAAGVAKGLLFHHFGDKERLFVAVFDAVLERPSTRAARLLEELPADLFERLYAVAVRKLESAHADPLAYQFLTMALQEAPPQAREALRERQARLTTQSLPPLLEGLDTSRLRHGVSMEQALETILALNEGLWHLYAPRLNALPDRGASQLDALTRSLWVHYERLRDGLYAPAPEKKKR